MIILRKFLTYNIAAFVAFELTKKTKNLKNATHSGIAYGLYFYLNLQKILLVPPIHASLGVIATVPPIPGAALASVNTIIPSPDILIGYLNKYVQGAPFLSPVSMNGMFTAISLWLNTPPMVASTVTSLSIPPTLAGAGTITFPIMSSLGTACYASTIAAGIVGMLIPTGIPPLEAPYEFLSNFIYAGLLVNFISPIPTTGVIGSAYTGITTPFWLMIDIPDFPINSLNMETLNEILAALGLTDLSDKTIKSVQEKIISDGDGLMYTGTDCDLVFEDGEFTANPTCTNAYAGTVLTNGCTSPTSTTIKDLLLDSPNAEVSAAAETVYQFLPDSTLLAMQSDPNTASNVQNLPTGDITTCEFINTTQTLEIINDNYNSKSSVAEILPTNILFEDEEILEGSININVLDVTVIARRRLIVVEDGLKPDEVAITYF